MKNIRLSRRNIGALIVVMFGLSGLPLVAAAESMSGMDDGAMSAKDSTKVSDEKRAMAMDPVTRPAEAAMQGGSAPADARDPHAFSDGMDFTGIKRPHFADEQNFAALWVNRLEAVRSNDNTSGVYDMQAWFGRDYDRLVLKAEGSVTEGTLEEARTELVWGHALATYWDAQLGLRYDSGDDPNRSWLAFGVQGLAPYWFELDIAAYVGERGRSALSLEAEYDILFSQRLILQPRFEMDVYGKDDAERGIGAGLSEMAAGLRLRYEIRREFAPYVGIEWAGKYGGSADYARAAGRDVSEVRSVAGVRFWF